MQKGKGSLAQLPGAFSMQNYKGALLQATPFFPGDFSDYPAKEKNSATSQKPFNDSGI